MLAPGRYKEWPDRGWLIFVGIVVLYTAICFPHLKDNHFFAPDADRIAMDGAFIKDFILDLPGSLIHPYEYTIQYYAKYPALSIGYRPPVFQILEAVFYLVFGTSYVSAKMAVLGFLFAGMFFWVRLVSQTHDFRFAVGSLVLWITNPMVYRYCQQTMLEIPTLSMLILSAYAIHRYGEKPSYRAALGMAVCIGLTLWTNQKSAFILLTMGCYIYLFCGWKSLFSRTSLFSYLILLVFIIPLGAMTLWLGAQNLSQSIGTGSGATIDRLSTIREWTENIWFFYNSHFSVPLVIFIVAGLVYSGVKKKKNVLIYFSIIVSAYIFFTYIKHDLPRYSMYWIPFFCLFAVQGITTLSRGVSVVIPKAGRASAVVILCAAVVYQLSLLPQVFVPTLSGYEAAARYTIEHSKSPVVWFDGYANGHFIYFMNVHDKKREFVVLRGDKLISSSSISYTNKLKVHLHNEKEIAKSLSDMGVQLIVLESSNHSGLAIYSQFRIMLKNDPQFKLLKTIDVKSNNQRYDKTKLLIYENLNWPGIDPDQELKLRLPVVGQTIEVKLGRILPGKQDTAE